MELAAACQIAQAVFQAVYFIYHHIYTIPVARQYYVYRNRQLSVHTIHTANE